jgi:hypothetical protein
MRVSCAYEIREGQSKFNRPSRIRVHIGKPAEIPAASDPQEIARILEQRVTELGHAPEKEEIAKVRATGE